MLRRKQVVIKHKEISILTSFDRALVIFYTKLLCSVYRISEYHFFYAHLLIYGRIRSDGPICFSGSGLLIYPPCHANLHTKVRTPVVKIAVVDIITGPCDIGTGLPNRLTAVHLICTLFTKQLTPVLIRISAHISRMPPWRIIGVNI